MLIMNQRVNSKFGEQAQNCFLNEQGALLQMYIKKAAGDTIGLRKLFSGYDERLVRLLELMLEYNLALRPSAE